MNKKTRRSALILFAEFVFLLSFSTPAFSQNRDASDAPWRIVLPTFTSLDVVDVGAGAVHATKDTVIIGYLKNTGPAPIRIDSITVGAPFVAVSGTQSFVIPTGGERAVEFLFQPATAGNFSSPVVIHTQRSKPVTKNIRGVGVMPKISLAGSIVDFGRIKVLATKDTSVIAVQCTTGGGAAVISGTKMLGPDTEQFSIIQGGGSSTLKDGESKAITLQFHPASPGRTSGRIAFYFDGPGSPAIMELFGEAEDETVTAAVKPCGEEEKPVSKIVVDEYVSTQFRPLLNYIFFGENKSVFEKRYKLFTPQEAVDFSLESLYLKEGLQVYYQVLNIIGRRMLDYPAATITVTGYNANTGREKENLALSGARAKTVAEYFKTVWRIPENRIKIEAKNLPMRPSNSEDQDGQFENRRVEITSDTYEIIEPVVSKGYERQTRPTTIKFQTSVNKGARIAQWTLVVRHNGNTLKTFVGNGNVPQSIDWNTQNEPESIPQTAGNLEYILTTTDRQNRSTSVQGELQVEYNKVNKQIGRYSLILFDYNQTTISQANRRIVAAIKKILPENADITVSGYTDRIGGEEYNKKLSEGRARNVASVLGVKGVVVQGIGKSVLLFDNDLPEGRFYSRIVIIIVQKKLVRE